VHHHQGGTVLSYRFFEKLADLYQRGVDIAFIDAGDGEHLVLGVYLNPPTAIASF